MTVNDAGPWWSGQLRTVTALVKKADELDLAPKTIISIQGGLGNQLFEWAFAHVLGVKGGQVIFDTVRCRGDRPLEIAPLLRGSRKLARPWGYTAVLAQRLGVLGEKPLLGSKWRLVSEPSFSHDPTFMDNLLSPSRAENYVLGYFQSPKYFDGYEAAIRRGISGLLHGMLTAQGQAMAAEIVASPKSVAVHVRRGDYVSNLTAAAHHGTLSGDYYAQAVSVLRDLGKSEVIWFSDDTEWVRNQLARASDTVATPELMAEMTTSAGGEIALMSACSSRVVANSSFSWWAGWLGAPSTELSPVIAPRQWLAGSEDPAEDLIPADWWRF